MKKGSFVPKSSIEEFIKMDPDYFDLIYKYYKSNRLLSTLDELDYFNHFYEMLEIIDLNMNDYFKLNDFLLSFKYSDDKVKNIGINLFFLRALLSTSFVKNYVAFTNEYFENGVPIFYFFFKKSLDEIYDNFFNKKRPVKPNPDMCFFIFADVKKELKYFNTNIEKLKYLHEVKTDFLQQNLPKKALIVNPFFDIDFDEKCDLEIKKLEKLIELENYKSPVKEDINKEKKKPGRKTTEIKPLKDYFFNIEKDRIPIFINALKNEFIDCTPKVFAYMIKTLETSKYISYATHSEIFAAFENEFEKQFGSVESKNKHLRLPEEGLDKDLLKRIQNKIENIKQSCLIV